MNIIRYLIKRIIATLPTLIGVSILVFFIVHIIPGDPIDVMLGDKASEQTKLELIEKLGLDKPIYIQYAEWAKNAIRGDFGTSIRTNEPVTREILSRFPATLEVSLIAIIIAVLFGLIFGVISARKRNTLGDHFITGISLIGVSVPVFWLGMMLIFFFSVLMAKTQIGGLPVSGRIPSNVSIQNFTGLYLVDSLIMGNFEYFVIAFKHLILPSIALSGISLAVITRFTRSTMLDVLSEDYIRTAKAKGVPSNNVIYKHALKNAMIPLFTIIGLQFAGLLGGAIMTETIFSWPGIGRLLITAISNRDYPMIQGIVLFVSLIFITFNIIVDILYAVVDPRVRLD